jgi:folate-binding protein YgfZ
MVTNSIQAMQPGEGNYNFLLNAQGRIQGDCTIYRETMAEPASFLISTSSRQIEAIQKHLDHFIIMDDVELTRAYEDEQTLILLGKGAPSALQSMGLPAIDPIHLVHASTEHGPVLLTAPLAGEIPCFELHAPVSTLNALRHTIDAPELSAEALETLRILRAIPSYGIDIRERDLPQETNQPHALHFNKGCYLGQEIVERIRSRGQVHRTFTQFKLKGEFPALPAELTANGKPAGELTSAAEINGTIVALGYGRREALDLHQPLNYSSGTAEPANTSKLLAEIIS